jgi:hypothetical protein
VAKGQAREGRSGSMDRKTVHIPAAQRGSDRRRSQFRRPPRFAWPPCAAAVRP